MAAPTEIIMALESIIDIYLSGIRNKERAVYILCDNLVEMSCKTKALQHNYTFDMTCNFYNSWTANGVTLAPNGLGGRVQGRRVTRNSMQHANAAITANIQLCADAILDCVRVIDQCWRNTSRTHFPEWVQCALRIVGLYSRSGDVLKHQPFEDAMRKIHWRGARTSVRTIEIQIEPGIRDFWYYIVKSNTASVDSCLNQLAI